MDRPNDPQGKTGKYTQAVRDLGVEARRADRERLHVFLRRLGTSRRGQTPGAGS